MFQNTIGFSKIDKQNGTRLICKYQLSVYIVHKILEWAINLPRGAKRSLLSVTVSTTGSILLVGIVNICISVTVSTAGSVLRIIFVFMLRIRYRERLCLEKLIPYRLFGNWCYFLLLIFGVQIWFQHEHIGTFASCRKFNCLLDAVFNRYLVTYFFAAVVTVAFLLWCLHLA